MSQPGLLGRLVSAKGTNAEEWPYSPARPWALPRLWWLNVLLFLFTLLTTTVFGSALVSSFVHGRPFDEGDLFASFVSFWHRDPRILQGLMFSGPLLIILMAHEMGHYLVCVNRRVDATLPYFLPSPTLFGTLGAFIRIKTPIYTRRDLFDIGSAGPLAGFVILLPFLFAGLWLSHRLTGGDANAIIIGTPLGLRALEWLLFRSYGIEPHFAPSHGHRRRLPGCFSPRSTFCRSGNSMAATSCTLCLASEDIK